VKAPQPDAYSLALHRLSVREYGKKELKAYLKRKGIAEAEAEAALGRLIEEGTLSEERYMLAVIRSQAARGKGPAYIRQKLQQKGVHVSQTELREHIGNASIEDESEVIRKIIERKYPQAHKDRAVYRRAFQTLLRRGFSASAIQKVLKVP